MCYLDKKYSGKTNVEKLGKKENDDGEKKMVDLEIFLKPPSRNLRNHPKKEAGLCLDNPAQSPNGTLNCLAEGAESKFIHKLNKIVNAAACSDDEVRRSIFL